MSNEVFSFLEFGAIDPSAPNRLTWDFRTGQKAYDWLMVARYLNDIVAYQKLAASAVSGSEATCAEIFKADVHHQDDGGVNLNKVLALDCLSDYLGRSEGLRFFEFGSTLFGCIDAMEACANLIKRFKSEYSEIDLRTIRWIGVDNSPYLNTVAKITHSAYDIVTGLAMADIPPESDLFFAKGVSILYQVRSLQELVSVVDHSTLGIFDYSLSYTGERDFYIGSGKPLRYLDVTEAAPALDNDNTVMMVRRSRTRVEPHRERIIFNGVRGPRDLVGEYMARDTALRTQIASEAGDEAFKSMLWANNIPEDDWVSLCSYCRETGLL